MTSRPGVDTAVVRGIIAIATTVLARALIRCDAPASSSTLGVADSDAAVDRLVAGLVGVHDLADGNVAVRSQVRQLLRQAGVEMISAEPGSSFDPTWQIAVDMQFGDVAQQGTVSRMVRPGWSRHGTVIRPTEVALWTS